MTEKAKCGLPADGRPAEQETHTQKNKTKLVFDFFLPSTVLHYICKFCCTFSVFCGLSVHASLTDEFPFLCRVNGQ